MNKNLETILLYLINKRIIGAKHTSENKLVQSKTKWISKEEKKEFAIQYKEIINKRIIIRVKKRTGKGSDWHISINPRKIKELNQILNL